MTEQLRRIEKFKIFCKKEHEGKLLTELISEKTSLSKSLVKRIMIYGGVVQSIKGKKKRARKASTLVKEGDIIEVNFDPKIDMTQEFEFKNKYESKNFGIYHKPAGAFSEGNQFGDQASLFRFVEKKKKYAYIVNRIDREVEGLIVVAYNSKAQNQLQSMWRSDVTKKYKAIVLGEVQGEGELTYSMNGKFAQTNYKSIEIKGGRTLLDIEAVTERKNQIRLHLSLLGNPVIGDPLYGKHNKNRDEGLKLISYQLSFIDPFTKKELNIELNNIDIAL